MKNNMHVLIISEKYDNPKTKKLAVSFSTFSGTFNDAFKEDDKYTSEHLTIFEPECHDEGIKSAKELDTILLEKKYEVNIVFCFDFLFLQSDIGTASDAYRVVFSWNEIYNTEAGNFLYFITEMKGKKMQDLEQRMVFLSAKDIKSGRRYIKCLQSIEIRRL